MIRAELFKLIKSQLFWVLFAFVFIMGFLNGRPGSAITGYTVYHVMLMPDILYSGLVGLWAASFVCDEFSNRTFGMSFFSGVTRCKVFLAKAVVFIAGGLLLLFLSVVIPMSVATVGNGFGTEWNKTVAYKMALGLVCFIFEGLFMECFALLTASLIRDRIGTFAVGTLGNYMIMLLTQSMENSISLMGAIFVLIFGVVASLWMAVAIFIKWDLR